jgi:hypothetical protein
LSPDSMPTSSRVLHYAGNTPASERSRYARGRAATTGAFNSNTAADDLQRVLAPTSRGD